MLCFNHLLSASFFHDPVVRYAATKLTIREQEKERMKLKPMIISRDALAVDPGMSQKRLNRVAKNMVVEDDGDMRHAHMLSLEKRGETLRIAEGEAVAEWAPALSDLTPFQLKFALKACQDIYLTPQFQPFSLERLS